MHLGSWWWMTQVGTEQAHNVAFWRTGSGYHENRSWYTDGGCGEQMSGLTESSRDRDTPKSILMKRKTIRDGGEEDVGQSRAWCWRWLQAVRLPLFNVVAGCKLYVYPRLAVGAARRWHGCNLCLRSFFLEGSVAVIDAAVLHPREEVEGLSSGIVESSMYETGRPVRRSSIDVREKVENDGRGVDVREEEGRYMEAAMVRGRTEAVRR